MSTKKKRYENDSFGKIAVPKDCLWGAQTQRSINNFNIGSETFSNNFIKAFAVQKKACALANKDLKFLDSKDCHEYELQKNKFARKYEVFIYSSRQIVKGKNKLMYKKTLSINKDCIPSTGEGKYLYKYRIIDKWGRVSDFSPRGEIFFPISPLDDF